MKYPSKQEIEEYRQLHNADEVGINDQWSFEEAECYLLNDDKYHYLNQNFIDDKEKMVDFKKLSKEDFLKSYSYLSELEYNNTKELNI